MLYLAPEQAVQLGRALQKLENFIATGESSELMLHLLRKDLFDMIHFLSPLSKTRKLISEILDHTQECPPAEQKRIGELIISVKEIYRIQESEVTIHAGVPDDHKLKSVGKV